MKFPKFKLPGIGSMFPPEMLEGLAKMLFTPANIQKGLSAAKDFMKKQAQEQGGPVMGNFAYDPATDSLVLSLYRQQGERWEQVKAWSANDAGSVERLAEEFLNNAEKTEDANDTISHTAHQLSGSPTGAAAPAGSDTAAAGEQPAAPGA